MIQIFRTTVIIFLLFNMQSTTFTFHMKHLVAKVSEEVTY